MRFVFSILMALIFLIGSLNLRVDMHLCGGDIKDIAFIGEAQPCSHASPDNSNVPPCHSHSDDTEGKGCCDEQELKFDSLDEFYELTAELDPISFANDVSFVLSELTLLFPDNSSIPIAEYLNYKPPLISENLSVSFQVFRI